MKKERIFYLDFIRAFATIVIILTHFNAMYLYLPVPTPEKAVITTKVANIYIGSFGVTLFFIISGAALMYVYDNECKLKSFYKKRFITIYPMFWIGYTLAFLYRFYINRGMYFIKYFRKVKLPVAIVSLIILIVNTVVKPEINNSVQTTYVGFASFCVLVYLSKYLEVNAIKKICAIISKFSYAIFLVHHIIILELAKNFDLQNITRTNSYLLFMVCVIFIAIGAYLLFEIHEKTMSCLKDLITKKVKINN